MIKCPALAAGLIVFVAGCGGSGSTTSNAAAGPSDPAQAAAIAPNPCSSSRNCPFIDSIGIWFQVFSNDNGSPGGPWSFTFAGKNYTGTGDAEYGFINVPPGDYETSGQFSTSAFAITMGRQASIKGGVGPNTVKSLAGPLSQSQSSGGCSVAYFVPFGAPRPNTFKMQFTVVTGSSTC